MKVLKRNQLIILIISLMLITAGYLNFTANNNNTMTSGVVADLGDATLVNSKPEEEKEELSDEAEIDSNFENEENTNNNENNNQDSIQTNAKEDQYFSKSKLERDTMYSQILETYQEIFNNTNATSEQKTEAIKEISKVNNTKNSIMIAENLITAKGFEDIVIFVNNTSTSVIVKAKELLPEQIAQVQNIISRELNISIEQINISTK